MTLIFLDEDPWLQELTNCEQLCLDLAVRSDLLFSNAADSGSLASVRLLMRQCDQQLNQLRTSLYSEMVKDNITPEELERRERCIESLLDRLRHLRNRFATPFPEKKRAVDPNRDILFNERGNLPSGSAANPEDDIGRLRQSQRQAIAEQDKGLEELAKIISRQKNLAQTIDSEVTSQNHIVSDLTDSVGRVGLRTEAATARTSNLLVRDSTCGYWTIIITLFIGIIIIVIV